MPRGHFIKLLLYVAGIALLMLMKPLYSQLTELTHVPALFEHTLFRVAVAFLVVEAAKQAILITYRPDDPKRKRDNFTTGINHISTIIYGLMLTALVMSLLNISIKEAITTLSLLAAALVVMTKDYIANVINGMYMTFTKTINIGDQVAIGNSRGKILDITLTNVHLLNEDDDIIYIPNNRIFSEELHPPRFKKIEYRFSNQPYHYTRHRPPRKYHLEQYPKFSRDDFARYFCHQNSQHRISIRRLESTLCAKRPQKQSFRSSVKENHQKKIGESFVRKTAVRSSLKKKCFFLFEFTTSCTYLRAD